MKIAYVFHGHLRTFRNNDTIVPLLLDRHPGDVFIHTFAHRNFSGNKWHQDEGGAGDPVTDDDLEWLHNNYPNVVRIRVAGESCGGDLLEPRHRIMGFRVAKQLACEMRQQHEQETGLKYDVVFMARHDLGFHEPFDFPGEIKPDTFYGGYNANQERFGLDGEVFTYGRPEVVDACSIPAIPPELADEVPSWGDHGERLMTAARKLRGYKYEPHRIRHFLYRSEGRRLDVMA